MTDVLNEYDILFRKFYSDLFKYQTGKKDALHCKGCDTKKRFIINKDEFTIGRSRKNDLNYLYCNEISRFHITIIRKYGHYWLLDKNSSNGTRINDIEVPYNVMIKLKNKDVIESSVTKAFAPHSIIKKNS